MGRLMLKKKKKNNRPSFFKVMIGKFDEKLRVPTAFIRHFNGNLPYKSILRSPTGRSWTVKVKKNGNDLFFSNGWKEFVNDHALEFGDLLVFRYNGESKFNVKIYGRTACEKEVIFNDHGGEPIANLNKQKYEQEPMPNVKKENEAKPFYASEKPEPRKPAIGIETKAGAVVEALSIESKGLQFTAIWRPYRKHRLTIPKALAIKKGLKTKNNIILQDPEGRSWLVIILQRGDGRFEMADGWAKFCDGNRLADGDTCIFEFLNRRKGNYKLSVRIFREAEVEIPHTLLRCTKSTSTAPLDLITFDNDSQHLDTELRKVKSKCLKPAYATTLAEERAIKAANAFESENPLCRIIMRPSYVYKPCQLNVPSDFGKSLLMSECQFVTLRVPDGRTWQVRRCFSGHNTRLVKGWNDFVSDNHLEEGDICVFELVQRKNLEIKVSIFRVSEDVE